MTLGLCIKSANNIFRSMTHKCIQSLKIVRIGTILLVDWNKDKFLRIPDEGKSSGIYYIS